MQRQDGLDQTGRPGGRLGVTDHGFDRTQGTALRTAVFIEKPFEGLDLDLIAHAGAGAVGFDQIDRPRIDIGRGIGPAQGLELSLGPRCIDTLGFAVTAGTDAFDDRQDPIAVAAGVLKAFENQNADAFPQHGPVRIPGERPGISGG